MYYVVQVYSHSAGSVVCSSSSSSSTTSTSYYDSTSTSTIGSTRLGNS